MPKGSRLKRLSGSVLPRLKSLFVREIRTERLLIKSENRYAGPSLLRLREAIRWSGSSASDIGLVREHSIRVVKLQRAHGG
jgi:hypothetical protein